MGSLRDEHFQMCSGSCGLAIGLRKGGVLPAGPRMFGDGHLSTVSKGTRLRDPCRPDSTDASPRAFPGLTPASVPSLSAKTGDWKLACTWPQKPVVVDPKASLLGAGCGAFTLEDRPPPIRVGTLHFLIPQGMHPGLCTQPVLNWAWSLRTQGQWPDLPGPEP